MPVTPNPIGVADPSALAAARRGSPPRSFRDALDTVEIEAASPKLPAAAAAAPARLPGVLAPAWEAPPRGDARPALVVDADGAIRPVAPAGGPAEPLAEVTPEVFAADIDKIRQAMEQGQRDGAFLPGNQVGVNERGEIIVGGGGAPGAPPQALSQVTPEVFASPTRAASDPVELDTSELRDRVNEPVGGSLEGRRVVVFGNGSVGSLAALLMTQAGMGYFDLLDDDRVTRANLSRSVYIASDVGRHKTEALADRLRAVNPDVNVAIHTRSVQDVPGEELLDLLAGADVVIGATDDPSAQARINAAAFAAGVPAVFVGLYARAAAGEVILTVPGQTRCYACAAPVRAGLADRPASDYGTGRLQGEPALGCDIWRVVTMGARLALALVALQAGHNTELTRDLLRVLGRGETYLITATESDWGLFEPLLVGVPGQNGFPSVWMTVKGSDDCAICGTAPRPAEMVLAAAPDRDAMAAALDALGPLTAPAAPDGDAGLRGLDPSGLALDGEEAPHAR